MNMNNVMYDPPYAQNFIKCQQSPSLLGDFNPS